MRWLERLDALYEIGGGPGAESGRPPAEDEAHKLAAGWLREAGLAVEVDAHGNLIGRRHGDEPELPEVWTGSHLDSVPQGGRYDGALGVAGIEALERLGRRRRTLAIVAFRDEERGCAGSRGRPRRLPLPGAFRAPPRTGAAARPRRCSARRDFGIVGYQRGVKEFPGRAGHAGTTPMEGRECARRGG